MKIKYLFFLLMTFLVIDIEGMTKKQMEVTFEKYIDKMVRVSENRLSDEQVNELKRPRTLNDYNPDFVYTDEYKQRRTYVDISKKELIKEWQTHNPGHLWRSDHKLHHVMPLGYGGRNVWWNIFPLTQRNHWGAGTGIHSSNEFRQLFPLVKENQ